MLIFTAILPQKEGGPTPALAKPAPGSCFPVTLVLFGIVWDASSWLSSRERLCEPLPLTLAGPCKCDLDLQFPCTKPSPDPRWVPNWPGAACGALHTLCQGWNGCSKVTTSCFYCKFLLLSCQAHFPLNHIQVSTWAILTRHFTTCQMPVQALNQQCPCRVFI